MEPLIALVGVTLLGRGAGELGIDWLDSWAHALHLGLAAMFLLTASAHFLQPRRNALIAIVPPRLPNPALLITVTGVLEVAGAIGVLVPATSKLAAACLGLLMVAMFPANVYGIRERPQGSELVQGESLPIRTLLQIMFIAATAVVALS